MTVRRGGRTDGISQDHEPHSALVNTTNPLAGLAANNLVKLLQPTKTEWEVLSRRKAIFDAARKES